MPQSCILTFSDPAAYQSAIRVGNVEFLVAGKGDFEAELVQIDLGRLWLQRGSEVLPRIYRTATDSKRAPILFLADARQQSSRYSGMELAPGEIAFSAADTVNIHRSEGAYRWASMSLPPDNLAAAGLAIAGREVKRPAETRILRPNPASMVRLRALHEAVGQLARTAPGVLANPASAKAIEHEMVHAMILCLTEPPPQSRSHSSQHARVIARFEDFLARKRYEPLHLAEICAAIGVSERTLRTCCQEHLGMGPIHYLWRRRMHLAHRGLLLADPASATVTSIATDHGFWELGRFSVEYRVLFGESPSASLRRPPDEALGRKRGAERPLSDFT